MPLATLPGRGPITTTFRGALFPRIMSQSEFNCTNQSHTTLQCAQDCATIVPVNDTRTQCTTCFDASALFQCYPQLVRVVRICSICCLQHNVFASGAIRNAIQ